VVVWDFFDQQQKHLKMDGWNTIVSLLGCLGLFSGANLLLVSWSAFEPRKETLLPGKHGVPFLGRQL